MESDSSSSTCSIENDHEMEDNELKSMLNLISLRNSVVLSELDEVCGTRLDERKLWNSLRTERGSPKSQGIESEDEQPGIHINHPARVPALQAVTILTLKPVYLCECTKCRLTTKLEALEEEQRLKNEKQLRPLILPKGLPEVNKSDPKQMTSEVTTRAKINPYECPKCGKKFTSERGLRHHNIFYNNIQQPSLCHFCNQKFGSNYALNRHLMSVHLKDFLPSFECIVCKETFSTQRHLDQHTISHWVNNNNNNNSFSRHREKPARKSTPLALSVKPFVCTLCGETFAMKQSCCDHLRDDHGQNFPLRYCYWNEGHNAQDLGKIMGAYLLGARASGQDLDSFLQNPLRRKMWGTSATDDASK